MAKTKSNKTLKNIATGAGVGLGTLGLGMFAISRGKVLPKAVAKNLSKTYGDNLSYYVRGNLGSGIPDKAFELYSGAKIYRNPPSVKGSVINYMRGKEGLNPALGKSIPGMDKVKATHKVIQSKETYAMFEDKFKFYHNFKNPSVYMPKTYKGSQFKSLTDIQNKVGKDFILKDRFNMGGHSLKRPGKEYEYSEAGIKKYLTRDFIFQEKIPFKYEFRVHSLDDLPYFIREKHGKSPSAKIEDKILNFSRSAIKDMKKFKSDHHALDVVVTNDGKMKVIENNAASGYGVMSSSAPRLTNLIENKKLPFLGTQAKKVQSQAIGASVVAGVGTAGGLEVKDSLSKKAEKDGHNNRGKETMNKWTKSFNEEIIKYATLFDVFRDDINKEAGHGESMLAAEEAGQSTPEVQSGVQETFDITDVVEDINPTCPHNGAIGVAVDVSPSDVTFIVRNESGRYKPGDILTKTKDQMRVLAFGDSHDKIAEVVTPPGAKHKKPVDRDTQPSMAAPKGHPDHKDNYTKQEDGSLKQKPNENSLKAQKNSGGGSLSGLGKSAGNKYFTKQADDEAKQSKDPHRKAWTPKFSLDVLKSTDGMFGVRGNYGIGGSSKETGIFGGVGGSGGVKFDLTPGSNRVGGELYGRSHVGYKPKNEKYPSPYLEGTVGVNAKTGAKPNWMTSLNLGLKKDFKLDQGGTLSPYLKANFPSDKDYRGVEAGINYNF